MSQPSVSSSAPSRPRKLSPDQMFVRWAFVLLMAGGFAALSAKPLWRQAKTWRAHRVLRQLDSLPPTNQVQAKFQTLRMAHALAPRDPEVLRQVALAYSRPPVELAMQYWQALLETGRATKADRLQFLDVAIQLQQLKAASQEVAKLVQEAPQDVAVQRRAAEISQLTGDKAAALQHAQAAVKLQPDDIHAQGLLGEMLIKSGSASNSAAGKAWLIPIATRPGVHQARAAVLLAEYATLTAAERAAVIDSLTGMTNRTFRELASLTALKIEGEPTKREQLIQGMVREFKDRPMVERLFAADWLAQRGQGALAGPLLRESESRTNEFAYLARLEFLATTKDWSGLRTALSQKEPNVAPAFRQIYEASLLAGEGQSQKAEALFTTTLAGLENQPLTPLLLPMLASRAEAGGLNSIALNAHERRLAYPSQAPAAARDLLRLLAREERLALRLPALRVLHARSPEDVRIASQLYYVQALTGQSLGKTREGWQALLRLYPSQPECILGLALTEQRANQPREVQRILEANPLSGAELPPRMQAVYAVLLNETGRREQARGLAKRIPTDTLHAEERELLTPLLR